jgi:surfeit locus 1 family protein
METAHSYTAETSSQPSDLQIWRQLPRLLVSRNWRWMTLAVIVLAVILGRLGMWQLDRLSHRQAQNALISERTVAPPLVIDGTPVDAEANEYRQVIVSGEFDSSNEVVLRNRSMDGVPGMHILTPLHIDGSDKWVLVNRGWVPMQLAIPEERHQFAVTGHVRIEGYLRKPQVPTSSFGPQDNQPENGRLDAWFRPNVEQIEQQTPYPLLPFYIEQKPSDEINQLPQPQPQIELSEGSHLGYAIQWFSFMVVLLIGYAALVVTRTKQQMSEQTDAHEHT